MTLAVYNRSNNASVSNASYVPLVTMTGGIAIANVDD